MSSRPSLLYRLFGVGRLPRAMRPVLEREWIELLDEGLRGTIVYRNFHAPGRRHGYRISPFVGSLVVTKLRFAAFGYHRPLINVPVEGETSRKLRLSLERDGSVLLVAFEAADFHDDWSGTIECRFRTEKAPRFLEDLTGKQVGRN